jgi:predicted nucleic acid-binding protein
MNFQIAAMALLYTATLVMNNVREFSKVEGLVWEAWVV